MDLRRLPQGSRSNRCCPEWDGSFSVLTFLLWQRELKNSSKMAVSSLWSSWQLWPLSSWHNKERHSTTAPSWLGSDSKPAASLAGCFSWGTFGSGAPAPPGDVVSPEGMFSDVYTQKLESRDYNFFQIWGDQEKIWIPH